MGFIEAVKTCFVKAFVFKGRALRSEYWYFVLFCCLVNLAMELSIGILADEMLRNGLGILGLIYILFSLVIIFPNLSVTIRRLHDSGRSGWWVLIAFVPILGALCLLYWMVIKGDEGENRYGPNPLAADDFPHDAAFVDTNKT